MIKLVVINFKILVLNKIIKNNNNNNYKVL